MDYEQYVLSRVEHFVEDVRSKGFLNPSFPKRILEIQVEGDLTSIDQLCQASNISSSGYKDIYRARLGLSV